VREAVFTAIQQEADTAFVVTGYLDVVATTTAAETRFLFPRIVDLPLGTTRSEVRVPGRVSYGFELGQLDPNRISVRGDTLDLFVPPLSVFAAEPRLTYLEVQTTVGWRHFSPTGQEAERRAISLLGDALRRQGEAHLRDSIQPRINTAHAIRDMITPVLLSIGMANPMVRVHLGDGLVVETQGE
jgi:hypothetical protein